MGRSEVGKVARRQEETEAVWEAGGRVTERSSERGKATAAGTETTERVGAARGAAGINILMLSHKRHHR